MVLGKDIKSSLPRAVTRNGEDFMENKNESILASTFGGQKRWVNWKYEKDDHGNDTKVPFQLNGEDKASSTDPATWSTYEDVEKSSLNIGIVFTPDQLTLGVDMDHCLENGEIIHEEKEKIEKFTKEANTYTEVSPSETGLHTIFSLTSPLKLIRNKHAPFEAYTSGRYFTVTNKPYKETLPVRIITPKEAIRLLSIIGYPWSRNETKQNVTTDTLSLDDATILSKMFSSKNGDRIKALYNGDISLHKEDDSSADLALCSHLAFWTAKNHTQMERIWLTSPLGLREKTQKRKDYRDRTINTAMEGCSEIYSQKQDKVELINTTDTREISKTSQANILLEDILNRKDVSLFHDEQGDGYISLEIAGHKEIRACKSRAIKKWLSHEVYRTQKKAPGTEVINSILAVLEGKARFDGPEIELHNRTAWCGDELWYDLTNEEWQAVKINKEKWEIISKPPIIFKRYSHHKAQTMPVKNGDVKLFLNYVNIKNSEYRLLCLVFLISCFIPDFPHVMLVVFGAQGSSKSTLSKLKRLVIDPSLIEVASFPHGQKDLVQILAHHYFLFFDNVSYISEEQSDTLCKAITGGGHSTRELYSDDEDIIRNFKRCIGINGINLVTTRPDLLERSLLLELERIEETDRKTERELYESFQKDLPSILGGVFDILVKAINLRPAMKLDSRPRMADWALWGCAIAEALGYKKEEFLDAYHHNITHQTEMLVNENIVATAIITFMEDKVVWKDTSTELLTQLSNHASFANIDTREKYWPKGANTLSRKLNELSTPLKQMGILVTISTTGESRYIQIKKITNKDSEVDTDGSDDTI